MIWSRRAADFRGSRLLTTATVVPACLPTAGVQAVARVASSLRTQKMRRSSAARLTSSLTKPMFVAAMTYHASSRSSGRKPRRSHRTSPPETSPSMDGVTSGRHDDDVGARGEQRRHPSLGHVAAADHDGAPSGEPQGGGVRRVLVGHRLHCRDRGSRPLAERPPTGIGSETVTDACEESRMSLDRPVTPNPYDLLPAVPSFEVTSTDVADGQPLKDDHVAHLGNSSPQLSWSGFPDDTKSFTITCFDPDAPTPSGFWHWVLVDIPVSVTSLESGAGGRRAAHRCPKGPSCAATTAARRGSWARPRRRATRCTATSSWCTRCKEETLGVDSDATPAVVSFNLAFKTAGRAILHGTYQH